MKEKTKKQVCIAKGIVKRENKYLLVRREREWDKNTHNKWEFPGGKVDFGEDPKESAVREVLEESGFRTEPIKLIPKITTHIWEYENRITQVILIPYLCKLMGGKTSLNDKNINDVSWFTINEIKELETIPGTKELLEFLD